MNNTTQIYIHHKYQLTILLSDDTSQPFIHEREGKEHFIWTSLGMLVGGLLLTIFRNKGQLILDNTPEFLDYCAKSNGLVFFGSIGSGKTAILAHELPDENKYATFPCNLSWVEKSQIDFSHASSQRLGVTETIFLDEINLLFKGNIVQDVRERQRFLMHFIALSRHQGNRLFVNAQRLGQVSIEQREVTTAICQVSLLQKTDEGIYVQCVIWEAAVWTNSKTEQGFIIFVGKKYLDTYNSYWLKSLKYCHVNLANYEKLQVFGGHLKEAKVAITAEATLKVLSEEKVFKKLDNETNVPLWNFDEIGSQKVIDDNQMLVAQIEVVPPKSK